MLMCLWLTKLPVVLSAIESYYIKINSYFTLCNFELKLQIYATTIYLAKRLIPLRINNSNIKYNKILTIGKQQNAEILSNSSYKKIRNFTLRLLNQSTFNSPRETSEHMEMRKFTS